MTARIDTFESGRRDAEVRRRIAEVSDLWDYYMNHSRAESTARANTNAAWDRYYAAKTRLRRDYPSVAA